MMQEKMLKNANNASSKGELSKSEKSSQKNVEENVRQHRCEEYYCCEQNSLCDNGETCCVSVHSTR